MTNVQIQHVIDLINSDLKLREVDLYKSTFKLYKQEFSGFIQLWVLSNFGIFKLYDNKVDPKILKHMAREIMNQAVGDIIES